MKLLAIDTSTEACSAALLTGDAILEEYELAPRRHAELLLPMIDRLMVDSGIHVNELDAIAFGRGPGAFTGIRIATGIVQGIAFAADLPVAPVSTLAALAQRMNRQGNHSRVISAIDARMNEIYFGAYRTDPGGLMESLGEECVCRPLDARIPERDSWAGAGTGWGIYREILGAKIGERLEAVDPECFPAAQDIARLGRKMVNEGQVVDPASALPVYLRDKVAEKAGNSSSTG